jgi:hypothetical protein
MILKMTRNLNTFYRQGIASDIKEHNCCNGVLVGFSQAWTLPHLMLDLSSGLRSGEAVNSDIDSPEA